MIAEGLQAVVAEFRRADTISFSSYITNEEALILQKLKEAYGYKLHNPEAREFGAFLKTMCGVSKIAETTTLADVAQSDCVITFAGRFYDEASPLKIAMSEVQAKQGARLHILHPLEESRIKSDSMLRYEVGSEEGVAALLVNALADSSRLSERERDFLKMQDWGYISSESSLSDEELKPMFCDLYAATSPVLIIGTDVYSHPRALEIAKLLGILQKSSKLKILLMPPATNSLGVALICDLDEKCGDYTIGYEAQGDFTLSSLEGADFRIPNLQEQEGTLTNINKRVIPINPALPYEGYELNDIANALGIHKDNTIDYTKELPNERGFLNIAFDSLPNYFENSGKEVRGYALGNYLKESTNAQESELSDVGEISEFNGTVVYSPYISPFARESLGDEAVLRGSKQFSLAAKIASGEKIEMSCAQFSWRGKYSEDPALKGVVAIFIADKHARFPYGYPFWRVKIEKLKEGR